MKPIHLILAFAAVTAAQKPLKGGKKPAYIAHAPGGHGGHGVEAAPQGAYQGGGHQAAVVNHGGFGGGHHAGGGSFSSGIGKGGSKPTYPLLLSDTRTLNPDGTINFDYKADNGLHQGETVDGDGTRRGFYSYPGADGKLITVKYTAGKNGFVAEGPHLPTQPQAAPYNPKHTDDNYNSSPNKGSHFGGGHHFSQPQAAPQHHGGSYRPSGAGGHQGGHHGGQANHFSHSSGLGGGSSSFANFPDFSSQISHGSSGHGGQGAPSYSSGAGRYPGGGAALSGLGAGAGHHSSGHHGGSSSFSSLGGHGGGHGGANLENLNLGSQFSGPTFTANNPYQPSLAAANPNNPVNAGFDLGNGGHFSINFTPGVGQEYNPNELSGDFGSGGHHQGGGGGGGAGGHGGSYSSSSHGAQGRY